MREKVQLETGKEREGKNDRNTLYLQMKIKSDRRREKEENEY